MGPDRREDPDRQTEIDRRFAEIIAQLSPDEERWDAPAGDAAGPDRPAYDERPAQRESPDATDGDGTDRAADAAERDDPPQESAAEPPERPATPWRTPPSGSGSVLDDDGADSFVPAPPRPLPSGEDDLGFWAMIGCLAGGPIWLLYLFLFDPYAQPLWWVLACALIVAGVVQLIMRSPKNRDEDDDDDGAVL